MGCLGRSTLDFCPRPARKETNVPLQHRRSYRVSHIEMNKLNWLWQMDRLRFSISYLRWPIQKVMTFGFYQPVFKKVTLAGLNSLWQKECQISVKIGFLMIYSTKRDWYCYLGAKDDQTIRISNFFDETRLSRSLRPLRLLRPLRSLRLQRF